jgi:hypothetical protein
MGGIRANKCKIEILVVIEGKYVYRLDKGEQG